MSCSCIGGSEETAEFVFGGIDKVCLWINWFLEFTGGIGGGGAGGGGSGGGSRSEASDTEGGLGPRLHGFYFGLLLPCVGWVGSCFTRLAFGYDCLGLFAFGISCCHDDYVLVAMHYSPVVEFEIELSAKNDLSICFFQNTKNKSCLLGRNYF